MSQNEELNEADTRAELIDPVLRELGWKGDFIKREKSITGSRKRPDYHLRIKLASDQHQQAITVGVLEAKAERLPHTHGLEQAKRDAGLLNVPYGFSTNGHRVAQFDRYTGLTSEFPIENFPTPDTLRVLYEAKMGFSLDNPAARPLLIPYTGGDAVLRDYQDAAIRSVLEKLASCELRDDRKRALLSLATGAGKTRIAVYLLKKIADAAQGRFRALFVCDRDELRAQASKAFRNVFASNAAVVTSSNPQTNAQVLISTYQTLNVDTDSDDTANFLTANYPEDYFTHIVIDECHCSYSGKWREILTHNSNAAWIGLTATPRQIEGVELTGEDEQITADNYKDFGEPVYEYTMLQGVEDGYLAACEIFPGRSEPILELTTEQILARNPVDAITGLPIASERIRRPYTSRDIGRSLLLPDFEKWRCQDLFNFLLETGEAGQEPEQKTIIFCAKDYHADLITRYMNDLYASWCSKNNKRRAEPYAFKCTDAGNGQEAIPDFRASSRTHFIATTVDLLSTGVDVPCVRNIVFFAHIDSPISFYQMVGRGTRLDYGKRLFRVYDYTNARRLFGEAFVTQLSDIKQATDGASTNTTKGAEVTLQLEDTDDLIRYIPSDAQSG